MIAHGPAQGPYLRGRRHGGWSGEEHRSRGDLGQLLDWLRALWPFRRRPHREHRPRKVEQAPAATRRELGLALDTALHKVLRLVRQLPPTGSFIERLVGEVSDRWVVILDEAPGAALPGLVAWLLRQARARLLADPLLAREAFTLALASTERFPCDLVPHGLYLDTLAEARSVEALLALVDGDLARARRAVQHARCLHRGGVGDPMVKVEVVSAEALVAWAGGDAEACERGLRQAWGLLSSIGDLHRQATVLTALAWVLDHRGFPGDAAQARKEVQDLPEEMLREEPMGALAGVLEAWERRAALAAAAEARDDGENAVAAQQPAGQMEP